MFCSKCGANVADGAGFCSVCGASIGAAAAPAAAPAPQQYENQKNAIRQSELASLQNAYQYFSQRKDLFEQYEALHTLVNHYRGGAKSSLLVWGIIVSVIGLLMILADAGIGAFLVFFLPGAAMIAGGILMKVANRKKLAEYEAQYNQVMDQLIKYYDAYPNCPVGIEFADPDILAFLIDTIQSGRADTVKEAINLHV